MNVYPTNCRLAHRLNAYRTGFVKAPTPYPATCLLGHRLNAFRLGFTSGRIYFSLAGVARKDILIDSLSIADRLNEVANTMIATVRDVSPMEGQAIAVLLGSANGIPLFRGTIVRVTRVWRAAVPTLVLHQVEATDPTWGLQAGLFSGRYRQLSATTIALDLIARYAPGYTARVQPGLPVVDEITYTNATVIDALAQLAKRIGGYTRCDYRSVVHLWTTDADLPAPRPLRPGHPSLNSVGYTRDLTQIVTRAIVEGGGVNASAPIAPGSALLPVETIAWYAAGGGYVRSGPQRIRYTGVTAGGGGAFAGSGVSPTTAPIAALLAGAGPVNPGVHSYAYTFVDVPGGGGQGETLPSPLATVTVGAGVSGPAPAPALAPRGHVSSGLVIGTSYTYAWAWSYVDADGDVSQVSALSETRAETVQGWQGNSGSAAPSTALTAARDVSGAIDLGTHQYAYTFVTATGETLPAPIASVLLGPVPAPSGAPSIYQATSGTGANEKPADGYVAGASVRWAVVYGTTQTIPGAGGPGAANVPCSGLGPASGSFTLTAYGPGYVNKPLITVPTTGDPLAPWLTVYISIAGGPWVWCQTPMGTYQNLGFQTVEVGGPVTAIPVQPATPASAVVLSNIKVGGASVTARKVYRTAANSTALKLLTTIPNNTATTYSDAAADATLGADVPAVDVSTLPGGIVVSTYAGAWDPAAKRVIVYRKVGATYYRVLVLPVNVAWPAATATDTIADAAILAAPATYPAYGGATVTGSRVTVSGIAPGPSPVTARRVYRTAANGSQLQLLATITDNTTTTLGEDLTPDSGLGANAPTIDTAGLVAPSKLIPAGSTELLVTSTAPFASAGGWVLVGTQLVRYTGTTAGALTGIPATGDGAIVSSVAYGTLTTTMAALVGIPAAGAGAIAYPIKRGDPVNVVVIVDDAGAQTALAALLGGGDGVRESVVSDGRIGIPEATARGLALLATYHAAIETVAYRGRDPATQSGALIAVDLPGPLVVRGSYRVQDVTITTFHPDGRVLPTYETRASSIRFTFEDWVRRLADTTAPPLTGE